MVQYLALTYTADVDWTASEQAAGLADYREFAVEHADSILASAVLHPTSTATVVRVTSARGGDVVTADGPYAETKEALSAFIQNCAMRSNGDERAGQQLTQGDAFIGLPLDPELHIPTVATLCNGKTE